MTWQLQSSVHGKIKRLLMVESDNHPEIFKKLVLQIYEKKSTHTQLVVWSNSEEKSINLEKIVLKGYECTRNVEVEKPAILLLLHQDTENGSLEEWVRDPFFVFHGYFHGQLCSIGINSANPVKNSNLLAILSKEKVLQCGETVSWFNFEGGHILSTHNSVLLPEYAFNTMLLSLKLKPYDVELGKNILGRFLNVSPCNIYLVSLGDYEDNEMNSSIGANLDKENSNNKSLADDLKKSINYSHHLDLFITLTGEVVKDGTCEKEILLIAKLDWVPDATISPKSKKSQKAVDAINKKLYKAADDLREMFHVVRNPVPIVEVQANAWETYYYNNCLVENTSESKTVWLPCYTCPHGSTIDAQLKLYFETNVQIWRAIGFKVKIIEADFSTYSGAMGSLHCLTKEIIREGN